MVRFKNRYMLCEIVYVDNKRIQRNLNGQEVFNAVKNALIKYHGDYGVGVLLTSLSVIYVNPHTNIVILRAKRGAHQMVQSAMFFISKIGTYDAFLRTLHIGGTIRTCQKFLINYNREQLPSLLRECKTQDERQDVQSAILGHTLTRQKDDPDITGE